MRVYLDNCCYNRPFDNQAHIRVRLKAEAIIHIQHKIVNREIEIAWSYILDYENLLNPFKERRNIIEEWKTHAVVDIEETSSILQHALSIQQIGVKSKDALHVACAIESKSDYFLSTDDILLKKLSNYQKIKVVNPLYLITLF